MGSKTAVAEGHKSPFAVLAMLLDKIERIMARGASVAILVIMVAVIADVIGRFVFNHPIAGVYELVELLTVATVFLGLSYIQTKGRHVQMEFLIKKLPGKGFRMMGAFALAASLWIMAMLTYKSLMLTVADMQMGSMRPGLVEFPWWPSEIMVPLGSGVLCLRFLVQILRRQFTFGKEETAELDAEMEKE